MPYRGYDRGSFIGRARNLSLRASSVGRAAHWQSEVGLDVRNPACFWQPARLGTYPFLYLPISRHYSLSIGRGTVMRSPDREDDEPDQGRSCRTSRCRAMLTKPRLGQRYYRLRPDLHNLSRYRMTGCSVREPVIGTGTPSPSGSSR